MSGKKIPVFLALAFCLAMLSCLAHAGEKTIIKVNATYHPRTFGDHPIVYLTQEFKKRLEEKLPGRVEVRLYWDNQLAKTYESAVNALQTNVIHLSNFPLTSVAEFSPAFIPLSNLFLFPYPYIDLVYQAYDGEVGAMARDRLIQDARLRPVCYWEVGFRHLLNNKNPITDVSSLNDIKFRVQPNPVHIASWKALGTNPTPVTWSELFTALQQGVVDGTENPFENVMSARLYEVQKYLTLTGHGFEMSGWLMSEEFYQGMPDDVRAAMDETFAELLPLHRDAFAQKNKDWIEFLGTAGKGNMQINTLPMEELLRMRKVVEPMLQISRDLAGAEYTNTMYEIISRNEEEFLKNNPPAK